MSYRYYKKKLMCPRGEIGRHKGLKILALFGSASSSLAEGTTINLLMPLIICDNNIKSKKIKTKLKKILKNQEIKIKNLIIVIGGDGYMLHTLKKNKNPSNKFYGINSGNFGFLMNKFSPKE